ncbi:MAG TPA: T9SS type A sorting domain-containing protein, partial [Bacteroidia bacterium]|nr:T9SS type A sorting domain-containing protein [Bacteroidia bacterium]
PDSGFVLSGEINDGDYKIIMKTDKTGSFLWAKTLFSSVGGDQIRMYQVSIDRNGNIITLGNANSSSFNFDDALVCLDTSGNVLWSHLYGSSGSDFCGSFLNLPDGCFIFTGDASGFGSNGCYVVKTTQDGGSDCNFLETVTTDTTFNLITDTGIVWTNPQDFVQLISMVTDSVFVNETILCQSTGLDYTPKNTPSFVIFPNPSSGTITIQSTSESQSETYLNIINTLGQIAYSAKLDWNSTTIPTGNLDDGIYQCVFLDNSSEHILQSKLIITK